ncbi:hypothetical protein DFP93_10691 [Aneurinibacillus soli]|uniref:Uncharacterized protein n=1 Tax=Aneurinibacillus soli TaxID=1500254 RepID=A0A0U5B4U8_9BACL|nr:hypothetical protein [Aneurinibacillus soli]PYE61898.1 hypothetical protein DFP93_10691 [Aneurinibacillus soli]BAU29714.1 hypothetical protein CB4_03951 [Aneurinibacillus soli]
MDKITKLALWGYSSNSVKQLIQSLQLEHEKRYQQLQERLEELAHTNKKLRAEIINLQQELQETSDMDQHVSTLLQAHIEQTKAVFEMHEELKIFEQKDEEILKINQLHQKAVVSQALEKLGNLESLIQRRIREGEHG